MTSDVHDLHYQHAPATLDLLIKPFVGKPAAMVWARDEGSLLVGTADGEIIRVHPRRGTKRLATLNGSVSGLSWASGNLVALSAQGEVVWLDAHGDVCGRGEHDIVGVAHTWFDGDRTVVTGRGPAGYRLRVWKWSAMTLDAPVPGGCIPVRGVSGVGLARRTTRGLEWVSLDGDDRFSNEASLAEVLRTTGDGLAAWDDTGVRVWPSLEGEPVAWADRRVSVVARDPAQGHVAIGTLDGDVRVSRLRSAASRLGAVEVCDGPVRHLAFSPSEPWLASAGERLLLWSWRLDR